MEEDWLKSEQRAQILAGMGAAERKRRRYEWGSWGGGSAKTSKLAMFKKP